MSKQTNAKNRVKCTFLPVCAGVCYSNLENIFVQLIDTLLNNFHSFGLTIAKMLCMLTKMIHKYTTVSLAKVAI